MFDLKDELVSVELYDIDGKLGRRVEICGSDKKKELIDEQEDDDRIVTRDGMSIYSTKSKGKKMPLPYRVICSKEDMKKAWSILYEGYIAYHKEKIKKEEETILRLENEIKKTDALDESCFVESEMLMVSLLLWEAKRKEKDFFKIRSWGSQCFQKDCKKVVMNLDNDMRFDEFCEHDGYPSITITKTEYDNFYGYCMKEKLDECKKLMLDEALKFLNKQNQKKVQEVNADNDNLIKLITEKVMKTTK